MITTNKKVAVKPLGSPSARLKVEGGLARIDQFSKTVCSELVYPADHVDLPVGSKLYFKGDVGKRVVNSCYQNGDGPPFVLIDWGDVIGFERQADQASALEVATSPTFGWPHEMPAANCIHNHPSTEPGKCQVCP